MNLTTDLRKGLWAVAGILAFLAFLTVSAGSDGFLQPAQVSGLESQPAAEPQANQSPELKPFPDPSLLDGPHPIRMPGLIVDTGVYFEVRDSVYLDVSLRSSEEIKVYLESLPETITLSVEGVGSVDSTVLTIQGLTPGKTYYKYQGSPSNEAVFVSNEQGSHTWQHDLTGPYLVWIQEQKEPVFLQDDASKPSKQDTPSSFDALSQGLIQSMEAVVTIYVPDDYSTIQSAVTAASPGDTIIVRPGTYTENVNINKAYLTLKSESGAAQTIIQAADSNDYVVEIIANYVTVDGFTLTGGRSGIYFGKVNTENVANYSIISNNQILENNYAIVSGYARWCNIWGSCYWDGSDSDLIKDNELALIANGIFLGHGDNHIVMGNTITGNNTGTGISFGYYSSDNEVTNNTITDFSTGISLGFSEDNQFTDNTISGNVGGLFTARASGNTFTGNTISNNSEYGLRLEYASVKLYHNNFINNGTQVIRHIYEPFVNSWLSLYEEYPIGGNYWSGHISEDNYSGPNQDQPGSDGIGETSYSVLGRFCAIDCDWVRAYDNYPFLQETGWEAPSAPDFWIDRIRPVQVVWDPDINEDGKIDLVAGKSTMVRVEVGMENYEELDEQQVVEIQLAFEGLDYLATSTIEQLEENNKQIDFYPFSPTILGDQIIMAEIDPNIEESNEANNTTSTTITVKDTHGLNIKYFRVERPGSYGSSYYPYEEAVEKSGEFIQATYPIAKTEFIAEQRNEIIQGHARKLLRYYGIARDSFTIHRQAKRLGADRGVGIVPFDYFNYHGVEGVSGLSFGPIPMVKGIVVEPEYWAAPAHEVGHTYRLRWPKEEYTEDYDGNSASGFWVTRKEPIEDSVCFMRRDQEFKSFSTTWIDNDDYSYLFKKFRKDKSDPVILIVSGIIYKDGTIELEKWYKIEEGLDDLDEIIPGDYFLQTLDEDKNILQQISFDVEFWASVDPIGVIEMDFAPFSFAIIYHGDTSFVKILHQDEIISEVELNTKLFSDGIDSLPSDYDMLIKSVEEADIQRGIKNSLLSKLTNAKKKMEDGATYIEEGRNKQGKNMLNAASDIVNAFINEVDAQRNKKILEEDADRFITWAQKMMLGLQNQIVESL